MPAEQYRSQLQALLPIGAAWTREPQAVLTQLLDAFAQELARVDARAAVLVDEADPRTTSELLADWERAFALPGDCITTVQTAQARRDALLSKMAGLGGQSIQYFIDLAARLGYTITISEYSPFKAGLSQAGDPLTNGDWAFAWRVSGTNATNVRTFKAGQGKAGEPLGSSSNEALECVIRDAKPAHTFVSFAYS